MAAGMREYSRVAPTFWNGPTGRAIKAKGRDAQVLALYLFTGPSATMMGLYYLPLPTLCHEAGFTMEEAKATLSVLAALDFAHYDEENEWVWVPAAAEYQIAERLAPDDNRVKGIIRSLEPFLSHAFGRAFAKRYREAYHLPASIIPPKGLRRPSLAPPKPGTGTEAGTEAGTGSENGASPASAGSDPVVVVFDHWRSTLQHPEAKLTPKRRRLVRERLGEGYTVADVRRAIEGCRASPFHMGVNDRRRVYDDIALICRDGEHVEQFKALWKQPPRPEADLQAEETASWDAVPALVDEFMAWYTENPEAGETLGRRGYHGQAFGGWPRGRDLPPGPKDAVLKGALKKLKEAPTGARRAG